MTVPSSLLTFLLIPFLAVPAFAEFRDGQIADLVLGQADFDSETMETPPTAASLRKPSGIAIDPTSGDVWVCDRGNNRILRFGSINELVNGGAAINVLGQANFVSGDPNRGVTVANNTLFGPRGIFFDAGGNLWVADLQNNRVLEFQDAKNKNDGDPADRVFGQPNFTSNTAGTTNSLLRGPWNVFVANDVLWIADFGNNRVLALNGLAMADSGDPATGVFGQADFNSMVDDNDTAVTSSTLDNPADMFVDADDTLWVLDSQNHRVLRYEDASTLLNSGSGPAADSVLGQPAFNGQSFGFDQDRLRSPTSFHLTPEGSLWIAEGNNNRIIRYRNAATASLRVNADLVIGKSIYNDASSGLSRTRIEFPTGLAFDGNNLFLCADENNERVLLFDAIQNHPDMSVGKKRSNVTSSKITVKTSRKTAKSYSSIRNLSSVFDSFVLSGPKTSKNFKIKHFQLTPARQNITAALKRGTHPSGDMTSAGTILIQTKVKKRKKKSKTNLRFTGISNQNGSIDTAKSKIKFK